jgi:hypothetical protein
LIIIYVKPKSSDLPANTAPRLSPLLGAVQAGIAVSFSGDEKDKLLHRPDREPAEPIEVAGWTDS